MKRTYTSNELFFHRHRNGIKLYTPDQIQKNNSLPNIYINKTTLSSILNLPFPIFFENIEHIAEICNETCVEEAGFDSIRECLTKEWFKPFKKNSVLQSIVNDKEVVREKKFKITEEQAIRKDEISFHALCIRMPWYNNENKIIGLFGCSILLNKHPLSNSLSLLSELGLLNNNDKPPNLFYGKLNDIYLSKREIECLSLTARGKTAKQVGHELGISRRTVEEYLDNIKVKMGVYSKSQLIDKAIVFLKLHEL
jgi:DNA-binding CsgD family transcriptional regulator